MKKYRDLISEITKKLSPERKDSKADPHYTVSGDQYSTDEGDSAYEAGTKSKDNSESHGNVAPKNGEREFPKQGSSPNPSKVLTKLAKAIKKTPLRTGDKAGGEKTPIKSTSAPIKEYYENQSIANGSSGTEPYDAKKHKVFAKITHIKNGDGSSSKHINIFHACDKDEALIKLGQQNPYYIDHNTKIKELPSTHPAHQKYVAVQKQRNRLNRESDKMMVKHLVQKHGFKHAGKKMDAEKISEEKKG